MPSELYLGIESDEFELDHKHEWTGPLGRDCAKAMQNPKDKRFRRDKRDWRVFAGLMVDFMLDVANGAELWRGYEAWNLRHFLVALPITGGEPGEGVTRTRLSHCVWKMLTVLDYGLTPPPDHPDLLKLTETVAAFWEKRQSDVPKDCGATAFVAGPNREGYLVKRKLRILAETSYLLRTSCRKYLDDFAGTQSEIDAIDSFLCQACTPWSGMGAVDLLAEILDIPDARREDIRAWSQRHLAPYRIERVKRDRLIVINLITDTPYETEFDNTSPEFHVGMILFGALVPWDGHWRWSGVQRLLDDSLPVNTIAEQLRDNMKRKMSKVLCRYWPEYREQVFKLSSELHEARMIHHQGQELVYFKDAKSLVEDNELFFKKQREELMKARGECESDSTMASDDDRQLPDLSMDLPAHLRDSTDGIGEFLDPIEGSEMVFGYDFLLSALNKSGVALTRDERSVLREFIQGEAISPAFVKRVLREHSPAAIQAEFGLRADAPEYWVEWLLRCWKGEYYRIRYPELSVV